MSGANASPTGRSRQVMTAHIFSFRTTLYSGSRAVRPRLQSTIQQLLRSEKRIKRISFHNRLRSPLFAVDNTKRRSDAVSRSFGQFACLDDGLAAGAHIIDYRDAGTSRTVPSFNPSLHSMSLRFLAHDESRQRIALNAADHSDGRCHGIRSQRETADRIRLNIQLAHFGKNEPRDEKRSARIQRRHTAIQVIAGLFSGRQYEISDAKRALSHNLRQFLKFVGHMRSITRGLE